MQNKPQRIQEIDNSTKEKIRAVDFTGVNFFDRDFALVMDNAPVAKTFVPDTPMRSSEHRVVLVKEGSADYSFNFTDYHLTTGDLLLIPANYIINIDSFSSTFKIRVVSFRFADASDAQLVGFEVIHLHLGLSEQQVFENFFQMMHCVLAAPTPDRRDFEHLVLSMLFRIQNDNVMQCGGNKPVIGDHRQQVLAKFMQLVNQTDNKMPRTVGAYAQAIGVTNNYLSVTVKNLSTRTVMDWVDIRTDLLIKALLNDPSAPSVESIAEQLDFSSSSQMIRFFRKMNGKTPLDYRKERTRVPDDSL